MSASRVLCRSMRVSGAKVPQVVHLRSRVPVSGGGGVAGPGLASGFIASFTDFISKLDTARKKATARIEITRPMRYFIIIEMERASYG